MTTHLTSFGVEEYTGTITSANSTNTTASASAIAAQQQANLSKNMWNSWAVYTCFILLILLGLGIVWGYRKDKRDEINYSQIRSEKKKLFVGIYLDPIIVARKENKKDTEKLVATT